MSGIDLELSREQLENLNEEDLRQLYRKMEKHAEASLYAKGDIYLENAHSDQIDFHKAKNRVRIFFGGNRCLAKGTLIATPSGPVKIEDLGPGDLVYDEHCQPIKIKKIFYNLVKEVADLVDDKGEVWASCTSNHAWLVKHKFRRWELCAAFIDEAHTVERRAIDSEVSKDSPNPDGVPLTWGYNKRMEHVYDIHVDSLTNLYCLANGLVTHNSGKSTAGVNESRWLAEGSHPHRSFRTPTKGCIVLQDFQTHAQDIILPKIKEWFPPNLIIDRQKNQAGVVVKMTCKNGSTIDIKSHDQDIKVFEGSDYDWIWFDEPPPQAIFRALWRGLTDRRGIAFITGTPITEPWLFDLYKKAAAANNQGTYWSIFSDIHKNAKNLGEGDEEEGNKRIEEFLDALDPEEREAREKGKFLHMSGIIFKVWDKDTHLIEPFPWPHTWPIILSLDPHARKPWAVSFLGLTPSGNKILISSYKFDGVVEDVAHQILEAKDDIELDNDLSKPMITSCWIDNAANVESFTTKGSNGRGVKILDELNFHVYPTLPKFKPAPKNVEDKILMFKDWLQPKESKFGLRPSFFAFDNHENNGPANDPVHAGFVYEMEHYVWQKHRGVNKNKHKNVPVKDNDDILDTIMQVCLVLGSKKGQDQLTNRPKAHNYARSRT